MSKPMSPNAVNKAKDAIKALMELVKTNISYTFGLEVNAMINRIKKEIKKGEIK